MDDSEIEKRFEVLEMKFAFQEELIQQLDDALISQQNQITQYKTQIEMLRDELRTLENHGSDEPEPPPPHY